MTPPKISIITPSYNQAPYIEATLRSVLDEQDYPNLEYWVIDGGSTDGTLDILRRYEGRLRWISEPDGGQADAINKGMRLATGDILAWMNSDDLYAPGALRAAGEYFAAHPETMFLYGDALAIDEHDASHGIRVHVRAADADYLVNTGDPIVQPASFWRREVWQACGELDVSLRYALDYEYWMRVARRYPLTYLPVVLAKERLYADAKTFRGSIARSEEIAASARRHGGAGFPSHFADEAAVSYLMRALRLALRRDLAGARADLGRARAARHSWYRFVLYLGVNMLLGARGVPRARLLQNRLRQQRKHESRFPAAPAG